MDGKTAEITYRINIIGVDCRRPLINLEQKKRVFKKWANPGLFVIYFRSFQTNITNFLQKKQIFTTNICEKISIQYTVLGFEPTTFGT